MAKKPSSTTASRASGGREWWPPWSEQPHSESESKGEAVPVEDRLEGAERGLKVSSVKERALETEDEAEGEKAVLRRRRELVRRAEGVKAGKREEGILIIVRVVMQRFAGVVEVVVSLRVSGRYGDGVVQMTTGRCRSN
jgi:hypothetical protein